MMCTQTWQGRDAEGRLRQRTRSKCCQRGTTSHFHGRITGWPVVGNEGMNPYHNHVQLHSLIPHFSGQPDYHLLYLLFLVHIAFPSSSPVRFLLTFSFCHLSIYRTLLFLTSRHYIHTCQVTYRTLAVKKSNVYIYIYLIARAMCEIA